MSGRGRAGEASGVAAGGLRAAVAGVAVGSTASDQDRPEAGGGGGEAVGPAPVAVELELCPAAVADDLAGDMLHTAGRLTFHTRHAVLRLPANWPWASELAAAFARLRELPSSAG